MDVEYWLNGICFQWDHGKVATNVRRHGVAFETACEAFFDPFIRWIESQVVDREERERIVGMTTTGQSLIVVYVERRDVLRIISARPATSGERRQYGDY